MARSLATVGALAILFVVPVSPGFAQATDDPEAPAEVLRNDADDDGIVDFADLDDDNDGIVDVLEIAPDGADRDTDGDGVPDRLDLDSDNDGLVDWQESGAVLSVDLAGLGTLGGRLVGVVGANGLLDAMETGVDSGRPSFELVNSDRPLDALPDVLDLDSDNDGLPDLVEAGVSPALDTNGDARIDAPRGTVGADGIADYLQPQNDRSCCDVTGDGRVDQIPNNSDDAGLPDPLDLDSDDDGVFDILETGGADVDGDGRVDDFIDIAGKPDGYDDAYRVAPLVATDVNGNGLADQRDPFAIGSPDTSLPRDAEGGDANAGAEEEATPVVVPGVTFGDAGRPADDGGGSRVLTGLEASGCSVTSGSIDLVTLLAALVSVSVLGWRRSLRSAIRPVRRRAARSVPQSVPQSVLNCVPRRPRRTDDPVD